LDYESPYEAKLKEYEQRLAEIDKELLGKTEEVEELVDAETEELSTSKAFSVDQEIAGNDEIARAETLEDESPAKVVVEDAFCKPLEVAAIQAPRFKRRQTADRGR
jgi:phosphate uptake regulator